MRKLLRDQCGAVAPFLAATIFLLIGIGALAVELPRMANFTTDLQNAADAAALAGAAELTGLDGSINRATCAAINTFTNAQKFGSSSSSNITLGDISCNTAANITIDFLSAIPSSDTTAIPSSDVVCTVPKCTSTDDSDARFIRVTIANQGINFAFSSIFGISSATAGVSAVAGNDTELCQMPPMFLCNPTEPSNNTDTSLKVDYTQVGGASIEMYYPGNNAQLSAGNFGLLCPAGTQGQNCNPSSTNIEQMFADPKGTCTRTQNVSLLSKPGMDQNAENGLNVRLDDWASGSTIQGWRKNASYAPAYDVTQGRSVTSSDYNGQNACPNTGSNGTLFSEPTSGTSEPLMPDACLLNNNCAGVNGDTNVGNGSWDRTTYFNVNHDGNTASSSLGSSPSPYQVYRWEVQTASNVVAPGSTIVGSTNKTTEDGQSNAVGSGTNKGYACFKGGATTPDSYTYSTLSSVPGVSGGGSLSFQALTDRRVMPLAIVDCYATQLSGGKQTITPAEWDYTFIIGPSGDPFYSSANNSSKAIFVQLLGRMDDTALGQTIHNVIRLYRR